MSKEEVSKEGESLVVSGSGFFSSPVIQVKFVGDDGDFVLADGRLDPGGRGVIVAVPNLSGAGEGQGQADEEGGEEGEEKKASDEDAKEGDEEESTDKWFDVLVSFNLAQQRWRTLSSTPSTSPQSRNL